MDIKPTTPLVSWSLAKSVTSAIVGVRSADQQMTDFPDFSQYQLATTPVWNTSETAARNITGKWTPLACQILHIGLKVPISLATYNLLCILYLRQLP